MLRQCDVGQCYASVMLFVHACQGPRLECQKVATTFKDIWYAAVGAKIWPVPAWYSSIQPGLARFFPIFLSNFPSSWNHGNSSYEFIHLHVLFLRVLYRLHLLAGNYDAPMIMIALKTKVGKITFFQSSSLHGSPNITASTSSPISLDFQSFFKKKHLLPFLANQIWILWHMGSELNMRHLLQS